MSYHILILRQVCLMRQVFWPNLVSGRVVSFFLEFSAKAPNYARPGAWTTGSRLNRPNLRLSLQLSPPRRVAARGCGVSLFVCVRNFRAEDLEGGRASTMCGRPAPWSWGSCRRTLHHMRAPGTFGRTNQPGICTRRQDRGSGPHRRFGSPNGTRQMSRPAVA